MKYTYVVDVEFTAKTYKNDERSKKVRKTYIVETSNPSSIELQDKLYEKLAEICKSYLNQYNRIVTYKITKIIEPEIISLS